MFVYKKYIESFLGAFFIILLISCKSSTKDDITAMVAEWHGRSLEMPINFKTVIMGRDTICNFKHKSYAIVSFVDSSNCTSCRLRLSSWKDFIYNLDSLNEDSIPVYFILHPIDINELATILKRYDFSYPVCIDKDNSFKQLNNISDNEMFHTFLLDKDNKVVAVGNPVYNSKIKELYFNIVLGKDISTSNVQTTFLHIDKKIVNMGKFNWRDKVQTEFVLTNTGKIPLVIADISTSCGCVLVEYNKKPVLPNDSLIIVVEYTADVPGYFDKSMKIFCNIEESPLLLKIIGEASTN